MRRSLAPHPHSRRIAATGIDVDMARPEPGRLVLNYIVTGTIGGLRMPPVTASLRTDELWRHTCFEAFVRPWGGDAYYEFNFAPSTQWAAYGFAGYRSGMRVADEIHPPRIEVQATDQRFTLQAAVDLARLPGLRSDATWQIGLSAVIEDANGALSYWALAHPPERADFHHSDCFALELTRA